MQSSAIHDPYAHATPSELRFAAQHRTRLAKIAARKYRPAVLREPSPAIVRVTEVEPDLPVPTLEAPEPQVIPEIQNVAPRKVRIEEIQRIVVRECNLTRADILSPRRTAQVVRARQIAMYLAKKLTDRSLIEIGRRFGGRDHTTVLHSIRKISGLVLSDAALAEQCNAIEQELRR